MSIEGTTQEGTTQSTPAETPQSTANWNQVAPGWIEFVRTDPNAMSFRDHILKPALLDLLGPVEGKKVLDAGCGEGDISRTLAQKGAVVTGIDASDVLLDAAKASEEKDKRGITYLQRDVADLGDLADFDLAVSNQLISVVPDHAAAFRELHRVLRNGGTLVVSVTHPFFDGVGAGWVREADGEVRWYASRYIARIEGRAAHGAPTYHRSFSDYITTAISAGFLLAGFREPVASIEHSRQQVPWGRQNDPIPTLAVLKLIKQ
jgi:2-polyprenyl-3-methyl-5-hydroxy-6-metoxy-1,4-benzoquinol methylase